MILSSFSPSRGLLALGLALVMLGACAPAAAPPAAPKEPAAAPAKPAEPKRGGVLVFGQRAQPKGLDVWRGDVSEVRMLSGVYEYLLSLDYKAGVDYRKELVVKPALAERWEQPSPDTYIFHIRKGVKWHDGQPLTVDDVVFSLQQWREKTNPRPYDAGRDIGQVEKLDDARVKLTLKAPDVGFLPNIGYYSNQAFVLPKHVADRGDDFNKVAIGTGPFKVKSADPRSSVVVERNLDYWQSGKPYLDGAKVLVGLEQAGLQAAFIAKEFDLMNVGDKAQFDSVKAVARDIESESYAQTHNNTIHFVQTKPPFNDVRVRKAIHLTIDRQALVKALTFGLGPINPPGFVALTKGSIPLEELQKLPGYRQPKDQDIAEAKRLLKEAGYEGGLKFTVSFARDRTTTPPIAEAVAPMLKAIGVEMVINAVERGVYLDAYRKGQYESVMDLTANEFITPRLRGWFHSKGNDNIRGTEDPQLDALIEKQSQTFDPVERQKIFRQIQELLLDKMYSVPTIDLVSFALWHPWLKGYPGCYCAQAFPTAWENMWLDPEKAPKRSLG